MDPQFECPGVLPTELIMKFPLATVCRSTLYQQCYVIVLPLSIEGRKEMIYLTTHLIHFIYDYMVSDIW